MTSWDFFDTLCGRRTGAHPWRLFDWVAGDEYRRLRQAAELASDKTWDGIFTSLQSITGWPAARIADLKAREWEAEKAAAFPIVENVSRVRPGDRIVSDCYFTTPQVRELAERIGIPRTVDVVTSWDAKWTGRWWRSETAAQATLHIGDNARSDHAQARAAGIAAELYTGSRPTRDEAEVDAAGRWQVAAAMRTSRLSGPPGDADWLAASQANVRFLLLAAGIVRRYVEAARPKRVYFVSRDTLLLQQAYAAAWDDLEVGTFWSSRETLQQPSRSYVAYVKSLAGDTLFVDLHGTGRSVREFVSESGVRLAYVFVCGQRSLPAVYPRLVELKGIGTGTAAEVMNYDLEGRVVDVVDGQPVRAAVEYGTEIVARHRAASIAGVTACVEPVDGVRPEEVARAAEAIRTSVSRELLGQHQVRHPEAGQAVSPGPAMRRGIGR